MRNTLAIVAILFGASLWAQEGPKISSAIINFDRSKDTVAALKNIQEAEEVIQSKNLSDVKGKDLAKFYLYKGKINFGIVQSGKPATRALAPNGMEEAAEAFQKLLAFEKAEGKERYSDEARQILPFIANYYAQRGIDASAKKEYQKAYEDFLLTYNFKKENNLGTDTAMLYNAAIMAQNAGDVENALKHTKQLVDMGYKGLQFKATNTSTNQVQEFANRAQMNAAIENTGGLYIDPVVEGDVRPDLYISMANLYKKSGDTAQYDATVAKGREMFPNNKSLLLLELQKYLDTKQYDKAMVNLEQAMEDDTTNALYPYLQGYIYQTEVKDLEKAKAGYMRAIELDPDYIEPQYMMGLIYVDKANEITEEMNSLNLNETKKYDALKKKQEEAFKNALPYFEKAREIDPNDMDTLRALKEVYYKLKMYEKAKEVQAKIDAKG